MKEIEILESEYLEKKLEIARHLLPAMVGQQTEAYMIDIRKRASLIYNCVAISDNLLREVGFKVQQKAQQKTQQAPVEPAELGDATTVRKLSDIFKDDK